jgi:serine/threonine protein kinase
VIGTTLKQYRVLHALGSGGMGQVYAAEDLTLGRRVALKVLPPEFADDPDRRQRFEREAKAVAALNHPNIVTIYSVEEAGGVHLYPSSTKSSESWNPGSSPLGRAQRRVWPSRAARTRQTSGWRR